ncbi:hypothetical protein AB0J83_37095 [Actinoplanes sp. NPDC049596]|uniref:hypothetical protein n=1 Tax=unclassified Actinoplanes TaxID=2626549 RepID=UPI0034284331
MTRAIVMDDYGSPDVLRLVETEAPPPGAGQIRVEVRYAGVGPTDLAIRAGHLDGVFRAGPGRAPRPCRLRARQPYGSSTSSP